MFSCSIELCVNLSRTSYRPVRTSPCSCEMFSCSIELYVRTSPGSCEIRTSPCSCHRHDETNRPIRTGHAAAKCLAVPSNYAELKAQGLARSQTRRNQQARPYRSCSSDMFSCFVFAPSQDNDKSDLIQARPYMQLRYIYLFYVCTIVRYVCTVTDTKPIKIVTATAGKINPTSYRPVRTSHAT
jgi:hypothetical protein